MPDTGAPPCSAPRCRATTAGRKGWTTLPRIRPAVQIPDKVGGLDCGEKILKQGLSSNKKISLPLKVTSEML